MKRAILSLATLALLSSTGCGGRRNCIDDVTVFWHFPNATGSAELSCAAAGVASVQVTVDGLTQGAPFPCASLASDNQTVVQGISLTNFDEFRHDFIVDGLDANGVLIYTDSFSFTPTGCRPNQVDTNLQPITGTLTVLPTFAAGAFQTCAAAGINDFFVELLDASNTAIPAYNAVFLPCVDTTSGIAFSMPGLAFGQVYTFRSLDSTLGTTTFVDQICGARAPFTVATQTFSPQLAALPAGVTATTCP